MKTNYYTNPYYDSLAEGALRSGRIIAPLVLKFFQPESVIDIGCGRGAWLKAFQENGIKKVTGIDGSYVDSEKLLISSSDFYAVDLTKPFPIQERYDLCICLEVAEHLPVNTGFALIKKLTELSDVILFSAAIPGQGGNHHINEQWPNYWSKIFGKYKFHKIDAIRPFIWQDERMDWWYRQNICLYASETIIAKTPFFQQELQTPSMGAFEIIHRDILEKNISCKGAFEELCRAVWTAVIYRIFGI